MNNTTEAVFALGPPLVISTSTGIVIGTIFSVLCVIKYLTDPGLRTHYTYMVTKLKIDKNSFLYFYL